MTKLKSLNLTAKFFPRPFGLVIGNTALHEFLEEFLTDELPVNKSQLKKVLKKIGKKR